MLQRFTKPTPEGMMIFRASTLAVLISAIALAPLGAQVDRTPDLGTTVPGSWNTSGIGAFRFWDGNIGYIPLAAPVNYNAWNTLAITFTGNTYEAFVNGTSQYVMSGDPGAERLTDAFVNTSNFGPNNNAS